MTICRKNYFLALIENYDLMGIADITSCDLSRGEEVEFMTMLWFDSIKSVRSFAGESYETPVISEKARSLLTRFADRADHYQLSGSNLFGVPNVG